MFLFLFPFFLPDIRVLLSNYIDLKMQSLQYQETVVLSEAKNEIYGSTSPPCVDYRIVQLTKPKKAGTVNAMVSPEDYDLVMNASKKWRLSESGYPIYVKRTGDNFVTVYMHRLIKGSSARHINGDRLDNRRINLAVSEKGPSFTRKRKRDGNEEDFIRTPRVLWENMNTFKHDDPSLNGFTGFANISYNQGKSYSGEIVDGKPGGYGHLYETLTSTQCCGTWKNGNMVKGMVVEYKPIPSCLCNIWKSCPFREVLKVDVVLDGRRQ